MRKSYYVGTVRGFVSGLLVEGGDNIYSAVTIFATVTIVVGGSNAEYGILINFGPKKSHAI